MVESTGPKISLFFLTLPNSDSGSEAVLPEIPMGNMESFCTFTVAWRRYFRGFKFDVRSVEKEWTISREGRPLQDRDVAEFIHAPGICNIIFRY